MKLSSSGGSIVAVGDGVGVVVGLGVVVGVSVDVGLTVALKPTVGEGKGSSKFGADPRFAILNNNSKPTNMPPAAHRSLMGTAPIDVFRGDFSFMSLLPTRG
jgi:hypothetical protein